jgi:hypothetical protein
MESLTRLVTDSLTRHGFDRPIDPHRLQWSRWFRCESSHSLLVVPSKPGIFAIAEDVGGVARAPSPASASSEQISDNSLLGGAALQRRDPAPQINAALAAEPKRMLAVLQFSEDDDMAFILDRMFTCINPMRSRLASGQCFLRFVVIEDQDQRRNICTALNQWLVSSAEKATGIPSAFASSLELPRVPLELPRMAPELPRVGAGDSPALSASAPLPAGAVAHLHSGAHKNLHCSQPLPSGF